MKNPAPLPVRGLIESRLLVAYTPVRPALVGEVISTSTRSDAAASARNAAGRRVGFGLVWRCNMQRDKHGLCGAVNPAAAGTPRMCRKPHQDSIVTPETVRRRSVCAADCAENRRVARL